MKGDYLVLKKVSCLLTASSASSSSLKPWVQTRCHHFIIKLKLSSFQAFKLLIPKLSSSESSQAQAGPHLTWLTPPEAEGLGPPRTQHLEPGKGKLRTSLQNCHTAFTASMATLLILQRSQYLRHMSVIHLNPQWQSEDTKMNDQSWGWGQVMMSWTYTEDLKWITKK